MKRLLGLVVVATLFFASMAIAEKPVPLWPAEKRGKWGLINAAGKWVVPPRFAEMKLFQEGLAPAKDGRGLWGAIDSSGGWIVKPRFNNMNAFCEGRATVELEPDPTSYGTYGVVNRTGKLLHPCTEHLVEPYSCGRALVFDMMNNVQGYLDLQGRLVIPKKFKLAGTFSEGLATAYDDTTKSIGYLDLNGHWAIAPRYKQAVNGAGPQSFSEGLAAAPDPISKKWGFLDKKGQWAIAPQFANVGSFHEGLAYIGTATPEQPEAGPLSYIDRTGKVVIGPKEGLVYGSGFSEGLVAVSDKAVLRSGKWGYMDKTGAIVIPLQFCYATGFKDGLATVGIPKPKSDKAYLAYIDRRGKMIHKNDQPSGVPITF